MTHQSIGYIRVSSIDQNPERQLADIKLDKKFTDTVSATCLTRPSLEDCINYIREGDILYVDSIDRLARNVRHLQDILNRLIEKRVTIKFVKESLSFSSMNDPMVNLTLHMMGAFAEFERNIIRSRQREGLEIARKSGKHLGRPFKVTPELKEKAIQMLKDGISIKKTAETLKVSRAALHKNLGRETLIKIQLYLVQNGK